jgi:ribose transport system substrate-binding protein
MKPSKYLDFIKKALVVACAAAATFSAIAQTPDQVDPQRQVFLQKLKGKKVVFIAIQMNVEHARVWMKRMKQELEPLGVTIEARDTKFDTNVGAQAFSQAIAQGANLIISWNLDRSSYARLIQQAQQKGIYVISIEMGSTAFADNFIGPDWVQLGKQQLLDTVAACKGKSNKIAIVAGGANSAVNVLAGAGIHEGLKEHPEITVVSEQTADWDASRAKNITATVLKQHPDVCGILGSWDGMDLGIAAAVKEAGLTGKVFVTSSGSGLKSVACDRVKDGSFDEYLSYDVASQAIQLTTMIKALLSSEQKPGQIQSISYTPLKIVTKSTFDKPGFCFTED